MLRKIGIAVLGLLIVATAFMALRFYRLGQESQVMEPNAGIVAGSLRPCPPKPNCVSSTEGEDADHRIAPIDFVGTDLETLDAIRKYLKNELEAEILLDTGEYIHAEVRSKVFGFVDDIEFLLRPEKGRISVRSASRVGHSDLGVNRKRVEKLREWLRSHGAVQETSV